MHRPAYRRPRRAARALALAAVAILGAAGPAAAEQPPANATPSDLDLTRVKEALDRLGSAVPQTTWGIDTVRRQVVVTIQDAARPEVAGRVRKAAAEHPDVVRVETAPGRLERHVADGDEISNGRVICSNGFNVLRGEQELLLTAGHCTAEGGRWNGGQVVASDFPEADSGLIENATGQGPGRVTGGGPAITSIGQPRVGQLVQKTGRTTGTTGGPIVTLDQTVNFDVGTVHHEFGAYLHSDHGDSGAPGYSGSTGLGTLSGGNQVITYFYPLSLSAARYGVRLAPAGTGAVAPVAVR